MARFDRNWLISVHSIILKKKTGRTEKNDGQLNTHDQNACVTLIIYFESSTLPWLVHMHHHPNIVARTVHLINVVLFRNLNHTAKLLSIVLLSEIR